MAAAQKKPAGTAKMTAPRTSTAAKKTQSAAAGIQRKHRHQSQSQQGHREQRRQ